MQAVIAKFIFNKNGGSIPVCTERKATGLFVLANFLCDNEIVSFFSVDHNDIDHKYCIDTGNLFSIYYSVLKISILKSSLTLRRHCISGPWFRSVRL